MRFHLSVLGPCSVCFGLLSDVRAQPPSGGVLPGPRATRGAPPRKRWAAQTQRAAARCVCRNYSACGTGFWAPAGQSCTQSTSRSVSVSPHPDQFEIHADLMPARAQCGDLCARGARPRRADRGTDGHSTVPRAVAAPYVRCCPVRTGLPATRVHPLPMDGSPAHGGDGGAAALAIGSWQTIGVGGRWQMVIVSPLELPIAALRLPSLPPPPGVSMDRALHADGTLWAAPLVPN